LLIVIPYEPDPSLAPFRVSRRVATRVEWNGMGHTPERFIHGFRRVLPPVFGNALWLRLQDAMNGPGTAYEACERVGELLWGSGRRGQYTPEICSDDEVLRIEMRPDGSHDLHPTGLRVPR